MIPYLVSTLEADTTFMALLNPNSRKIFMQSSLGVGDHPAEPEKMFVVLGELASVVHREVEETSNARTRTFQLWFYDDEGDYTVVDQAIHEFRRIVKSMAPFTFNGARCTESKFLGISGTLSDAQYHSSVKWASARFTVSN